LLFANSVLHDEPQPFADLHLSMYHLSIQSDGKLMVRASPLEIPNRTALVSAVRVIPGGKHDSIAAIVIVGTDMGLFVWIVSKEFITNSLKQFSASNIDFLHSSPQPSSLHVTVAGALTSVSPIIIDEHLSGIHMVKIIYFFLWCKNLSCIEFFTACVGL
jgi:hypothetical protein